MNLAHFGSGVTLRYYMDLGVLQYIHTLVSTRNKSFFLTHLSLNVSVLMTKKNSLFLQFPPISNHPVVVLQADSSNCLNESQ